MRNIKKAMRQAVKRDVYLTFPVRSVRALNKVKLFLRNQGIDVRELGADYIYRFIKSDNPHIIIWRDGIAELHTHDCHTCLRKTDLPFKILHGTL